MVRCVVLVRGVNVGGRNRLAMHVLTAAVEAAGGTSVTTYLNSGNAVCDAVPDGLAAAVEAALPLDVRVLVRTGSELSHAVAANPFPDRTNEPKRLHVAFLSEQPAPTAVAELGERHGADRMVVGDRIAYLAYGGGSQESTLTGALLERRLRVVASARNWTTLLRLVELTA